MKQKQRIQSTGGRHKKKVSSAPVSFGKKGRINHFAGEVFRVFQYVFSMIHRPHSEVFLLHAIRDQHGAIVSSYTRHARAHKLLRSSSLILGSFLLLAVIGGVMQPSVSAATIVVNSTSDVVASDGSCTLREAISNANNNADVTGGDCAAGSGTDTITFAIPGAGPHTIVVSSALPSISESIVIDGETQASASCAVRDLRIGVDGSAIGVGDILEISAGADSSTINGMVFFGNTSVNGLRVRSDSNSITCNHFGTSFDGNSASAAAGNAHGISVESPGSGNVVGGASIEAANVFGFNTNGVRDSASGTSYYGNYIGLGIDGSSDIGNTEVGIRALGDNIEIGGIVAGQGNYIVNNASGGVELSDGASGAEVYGNSIGLDVSGAAGSSDQEVGVQIYEDVDGTVIGGSTAGHRNYISGNSIEGINIGDSSDSTIIQGNYIGTNTTGVSAIGNGTGIQLDTGITGTQIGGSNPGEGNVVSGNSTAMNIIGVAGTTNIEGNFIGTNATGSSAVANSEGVVIRSSASGVTIGGSTDGHRNIISGNGDAGISLRTLASNIDIFGNYIGLNADGDAQLANGSGVEVLGGSSSVAIGGSVAGQGNVISGNSDQAITISSASTIDVVGNIIGLNAAGDGALPNDVGISENGSVSGLTIGGVTTSHRNIISGNTSEAITLSSDGATIQANYIGLNAAGDGVFGNNVAIDIASSSNVVGGSNADEANYVSGNPSGLQILGAGTSADNNTVQGNYFGTNGSGTPTDGFGNGFAISILGDASDNVIGGSELGEGNVIAYSGDADPAAGQGLIVAEVDGLGIPSGNSILRSTFIENNFEAIDFVVDSGGIQSEGPEANDILDGDDGPHDFLNHPVLTRVEFGGGSADIEFLLDVPAGDYRIEFYGNGSIHTSAHGQGEVYLGSSDITHAGSGIEEFSATVPSAASTVITSTATEDFGGGNFGATSTFGPSKVTAGTGLDFGDAPDDSAGTSSGDYESRGLDDGAYHVIKDIYLGSCVDADDGTNEGDGATADDDETAALILGVCVGGDDEDGVLFEPLDRGSTESVNITTSAAGVLNAWIDFNADGDFDDASEQIIDDQNVLSGGQDSYSFPVPAGAQTGTTYGRVRFGNRTGLASIGEEIGGEVEDYQIIVNDDPPTPNRVEGFVWNDSNSDTVKQNTEEYEAGITVALYEDDGNNAYGGGDTLLATKETTSQGAFEFTAVSQGVYFVLIDTPSGFDNTTLNPSSVISFNSEDETATRNFGIKQVSTPPPPTSVLGEIGGVVFEDADANGELGSLESGKDGVAVSLYSDTNGDLSYSAGSDDIVATESSSGGGRFEFSAISFGTYFLVVEVPTDRVLTTANNPTSALVVSSSNLSLSENFGMREGVVPVEPPEEEVPEEESPPNEEEAPQGGSEPEEPESENPSQESDENFFGLSGSIVPESGVSALVFGLSGGALLLALANLATLPFGGLVNLLRLLLGLFTEPLLALFGKKRMPWGSVFDSLKKVPVDLALVRLYEKPTGRLVSTAVTDQKGRFKFFAKPGKYTARVVKKGFIFPSAIMKKAPKYEKRDMYFGDDIQISAEGASFTDDIPVDGPKASGDARRVLVIQARRVLHTVLAFTGITIAVVNVFLLPSVLTVALLVLHSVLLAIFWRLSYTKKPRSWGRVYDQEIKKPVQKAIVRIYDQKFGRLLDTAITDASGKFGFLVGPSEYYIKVEAETYEFPAEKRLRNNDYLGGVIALKDESSMVNMNIPLRKSTKKVAAKSGQEIA